MAALSMLVFKPSGDPMPHQSVTVPFKALALLLWMALIGAVHTLSAQEDDAATIRALMAATWDKPNARLVVDPVVVDGEYSIAGWTQGQRGGRALLRKEAAKWTVVLCSGDPLKQAAPIEMAGVPHAAAVRLAHLVNVAESKLARERVALFSTFEGVVQMDEGHNHNHH
jgi:hypothetical protein